MAHASKDRGWRRNRRTMPNRCTVGSRESYIRAQFEVPRDQAGLSRQSRLSPSQSSFHCALRKYSQQPPVRSPSRSPPRSALCMPSQRSAAAEKPDRPSSRSSPGKLQHFNWPSLSLKATSDRASEKERLKWECDMLETRLRNRSRRTRTRRRS